MHNVVKKRPVPQELSDEQEVDGLLYSGISNENSAGVIVNEINISNRFNILLFLQDCNNGYIDNIDYNSNNNSDSKIKNNDIKCIYFNARSIVNKLSELELLIREENVDIIGISETWLLKDISDNEISFNGYSIFRCDRNDLVKKRGGGVLMYIRNELNPCLIDQLSDPSFNESVWCNIKCKSNSLTVGVVYRAPDSSQLNDEALYKLFDTFYDQRVLVMGDFNYPELDWCDRTNLDASHPFVECINGNFWEQYCNEPTRGNNYLDLVLCSEEIIQDLVVGEPFETSDHQMIRFNVKCKWENKRENKYDYFKANYDVIREYANGKNLFMSPCDDNANNVGELWNNISTGLHKIRNSFIKLKAKNRDRSKWSTRKVKSRRLAKKAAWNEYIKYGKDEALYKAYKKKLNKSTAENRKAKIKFEEKLALNIKNDSKSFFAYANANRKTSKKVGPLKDENKCVIHSNKCAANYLNKYFTSVFVEEDLITMPKPNKIFQGNTENCLQNVEINEDIVIEKLNSLNVSKSQGPDEIHGKLLHELSVELAPTLVTLFQASLDTGVVPQDFRDAVVVPLHKKGGRDKAENYRPISLTSIVGKILESIIKDNLVKFLNENSLIKDSQHGFMSGRSCLTNLLDFMEEITRELDRGNCMDVVYLDFAKAFDKVPHRRLLSKLEAHGIKGNVLEWIDSWLSDRRQRVCVEGELSDWARVKSGVPQGSVLGPLLFLIYINDIDEDILSKFAKFADDSKVARVVNNTDDAELLREDLEKLNKWSKDWQMEFNVDKCHVMHLGKNSLNSQYTLGGSILKPTESERDLGVFIDKSFKFSEQCNKAANSANAVIGMIRRTIKCRKKDIMVRLYKALVRPKLEYCVQAWCPYLKKDMDKLERVQARATRLINGCQNVTYENRLHYTGLTTLSERRIRGDLIEVFKILKGFSKVKCSTWFKLAVNSRTRGHNYKLVKSRSKLDIRKNFFSQRVVNEWNSLPGEVVQAESVNSFKNRYDKYRQR